MTYTAAISGTTATITLTENSNTTRLKIVDAANLSAELIALATDTSATFVDRTPAYMVYPTNTGVRIINQYGEITLPWRWVHPVGTSLAA